MFWKEIEWKEVLQVSVISGVLGFFAVHSSDYTNLSSFVSREAFEVVAFLGAIIAAGLVLNRRLSRKSDWGVLVGMIITWLVPLILDLLLSFLL